MPFQIIRDCGKWFACEVAAEWGGLSEDDARASLLKRLEGDVDSAKFDLKHAELELADAESARARGPVIKRLAKP